MKGERLVKRSEMTLGDLDATVIDDRPWLVRKACHGDPKRSIWVKGRPLCLCSRCMTFYPFIPVGSISILIFMNFFELASWQMLMIFALLEAPLVLDGWSQYIGWRRSNNKLRAVTGALAGAGIGSAITYMVLTVLF